MTDDILVIGVGNEFRRDDGIGLVVAAAIAQRGLPGVRVVTAIGEPGAVLDAWTGIALAVVVDAAAGKAAMPGAIRRWKRGDDDQPPVVSSHGFALSDTVALGEAIGRLPQQLVVFTVDVEDIGQGVGLSPSVAAAAPEVVEAIIAELGSR